MAFYAQSTGTVISGDRQTDRQAGRQADRQTDRQTDIDRQTQKEINTERDKGRQRDRNRSREIQTQKERYRQRETDRPTDRQSQTDKEREEPAEGTAAACVCCRVLAYNPHERDPGKRVQEMVTKLSYPDGLQLSRDESYLLIAEGARARIFK